MMKKQLFLLLVLAGYAIPVTQAQKVTIFPENAVMKDSLKMEVSKAPLDITLVKPDMAYKVTAKGYEELTLQFAKSKSGITFPESLVDCTPCLAEFSGSPFDEGVEKTMKLRLRKKVTEHRQSILLGVMTPRVDIPKETIVAVVNGKKIKIGNEDIHATMGYPQNLAHPLIGGLTNNFLAVYDNDEKNKDLTRLYMGKILVKPVIKGLSYRLNGKVLRDYAGPASIECDWQFYYTTDTTKMIGSIRTKTSLYRNAPDNNLPVHLLIYETAGDLSANDTLFTYLDRLEKEYMSKMVSTPTTVAKINETTFTTQKEMLKQLSEAVVTIENDEGFGSGILIDPSGIVLTNHHVVIDDTAGLMVRVPGSEDLLPAKIKVLNSDYDLALLELPPGKYKAISLHTKESLEVGDVVYAIGTPIDKTLGQSVTKGIVSGFRRINGVNFIQTDVSINSGNSGGALINESGHLVGIATMKAFGKGIEGLGFCIPSNTVEQALQLRYR